jgi:hypothetical protein
MFPYTGKKFTKNQIKFFVKVCIESVLDQLSCAIPGRWFGDNDEQHEREWKSELNSSRSREELENLIEDNIEHLGWNLSIFYAQVIDIEGMGTMDAVEIAGLEEEIRDWATDRLNGENGYRQVSEGRAVEDRPDVDSLVNKWTEAIFNWLEVI